MNFSFHSDFSLFRKHGDSYWQTQSTSWVKLPAGYLKEIETLPGLGTDSLPQPLIEPALLYLLLLCRQSLHRLGSSYPLSW